MRHAATFHGSDAGEVSVDLCESPGSGAVVARLALNSSTSLRLRDHFTASRSLGHYESTPSFYEGRARDALAHAAPELLSAANFARAFDPTVVEVTGLEPAQRAVATPSDGIVAEGSVDSHVFYLVSVFAGGFRLSGFAYPSENGGRILRAVAPNPRSANELSSQGYTEELAWHQDNANKPLPVRLHVSRGADRDFMNHYQAFVAVNVDDKTPMEIMALDDLIVDLEQEGCSKALEALQRPEFSVRSPASHSGGIALEGVPLLERDAAGRFHGRFHSANAVGLTPQSRDALKALGRCISNSTKSILYFGSPGSLLLYANTRVLHRRSRYMPSFRGKDRYFVRMYLAPNTVVSGMTRNKCPDTAHAPTTERG